MLHVRADKMAGRKSAAEGEFTSKGGGGDNAGETASVVTWVCRVRAADAEEIQHCCLGFEDCAAAEGANFDGGH